MKQRKLLGQASGMKIQTLQMTCRLIQKKKKKITECSEKAVGNKQRLIANELPVWMQ